MYILDIVVFNIKKELSVLSYWTNINCEVGDCIEIYIGKRLAQGVILNKQDLINNKYDIKKSSVQFRKINKVIKSGFINKDLLININNIARKNCLYTAQILETMLDNQSLELLSSININNTSDKNINYKKNNLIIYYPTIAELDRAYKDISQIFSQLKVKINIYKNHSKVKRLNKDYLINNINTIQNSVILSLPSLIPIIASDEYRPIIIASSESKYYENIKNINTKSILIDILKSLNKEVIMTDNIISVDTMYKLQNNELEIYNQNINQLMNTNLANKLRLVDRHSETIDRQGGYLPSEYIFSDKVLNLINKKISAGEPLIIMSLRKGSWTTSICRDCHTIIKCPTCKSTLVYYEMGKYFYCPYENIKYKIDENKLFRCSYCDSWRIDMLGITTQSIYNYLTNRYKDKNLNILITDTDIDKTNKQRIDKYNKWREEGGILISGVNIVDTIPTNDIINDVIIASIDSLFYINDYVIDEEIYKLLYKISNISNNIYIQTREYREDSKDNNILYKLRTNNLSDMLSDLLYSRLNNNLPPSNYILTIESKNDDIFIIPELSKMNSYKIKSGNIYKYVLFIDKNIWNNDKILQDIVLYNYSKYKLTIL